jgi:hypothetical protein
MTEEEIILLQKAADSIKYMPYIYRELPLVEGEFNENDHYIKHKVGQMDFNSVLFFVPRQVTSEGTSTQFVKMLAPGQTLLNQAKSYKIIIEAYSATSGTEFIECKKEHLFPHRLYMMRLYSETELIIINYRYDTSLVGTELKFQTALFGTVPEVGDEESSVLLVRKDDFDALTARVQALEDRFITGEGSAVEALDGAEPGTIYLKVDNYGSE